MIGCIIILLLKNIKIIIKSTKNEYKMRVFNLVLLKYFLRSELKFVV